MRKALNLIILLPLAVILILLSVANRQLVTLAFNPFRPEDSVLSLQAPFFVFLFIAVMIGIVLGSAATWFAQGKYRRRARTLRDENLKWQKNQPSIAVPDTRTRQISA